MSPAGRPHPLEAGADRLPLHPARSELGNLSIFLGRETLFTERRNEISTCSSLARENLERQLTARRHLWV